MPSRDRQPAKFGPIPPDLDLETLVEQTPNFVWADRISCHAIDEQGNDAFEKTVEALVIKKGMPLVVDGWQNKLERWTFSTQWLHDNVGGKFEDARQLNKGENLPLSISHYLNNMGKLCDQWDHSNYKDKSRQRLYLKDIDCPDLWHEKLKETIPGSVFYLNENTGEIGGPGSVEEPNQSGIGTKMSRGIARAGDLMSCLKPKMRAENLMCYIGHEGTYTPAHREMCASLGQNIMVETSGALDEGGKRSRPGSSIWLMTESHDRQVVSEYWLSMLGHDIEIEKHFAHINAWRNAPFKVYIVEQKLGDMILIPPLAPHQVWNRGTRTMKVAWNRTTVETLELAINEALPRSRLVCRDEQYKNKSIVLFSLHKYYTLLCQVEDKRQSAADRGDEMESKALSSLKIRQLRRDFKKLFNLFHRIMLSEMFSPDLPAEKKIEAIAYDSNVTCAYCRGNIFNRFLTCRHCIGDGVGADDAYDICMECYAMGRSCMCIAKLDWVEQFPWHDLLEKHEMWRNMFVRLDGGLKDTSPKQLAAEYHQLSSKARKRTLAELCQMELKKRPFRTSKKPGSDSEPPVDSSDEGDDNNGRASKRKKKKSEKWLAEHLPCHICCYRHPKWKEAICTSCSSAFCYGFLWRGFNMMPQDILEEKDWLCPKCKKNCTCTPCSKVPGNVPFEPSGTILGYDTRAFADPRSVESLVDFSVSNRHWIQKSGDVDNPEGSRRLQRRQSQATQRKEDADVDKDESDMEIDAVHAETPDSRPGTSDDDIPIDPALTGGKPIEWAEVKKREKARSQASKALEAVFLLENENSNSILSTDMPFTGDDGDTSFLPDNADPGNIDPSNGFQNEDTTHISPMTSTSKKRGRKSAPRIVSDLTLQPEEGNFTTESTANQKFQALAERRRIGEARRNKQLIAARAAVRGLRKMVVLKMGTSLLSRFPAGSSTVQVAAESERSDDQTQAPAPVITSNVPASPADQLASKPASVSKKRVRDADLDVDFNINRRGRRSQKQIREAKEIAMRDVEEQTLASDGEEASQSEEEQRTQSARKKRSPPVDQQDDQQDNRHVQFEDDEQSKHPKSIETGVLPNNTEEQSHSNPNREAKLRAAKGIDSDDEPTSPKPQRRSIFALRGRGAKIRIRGTRK